MMPNADPGLAFNCPKCPRRIGYVGSTGTPPTLTLHYECPIHGRWSVLLHTEPTLEPPPLRETPPIA
jgi:hypothetical protein